MSQQKKFPPPPPRGLPPQGDSWGVLDCLGDAEQNAGVGINEAVALKGKLIHLKKRFPPGTLPHGGGGTDGTRGTDQQQNCGEEWGRCVPGKRMVQKSPIMDSVPWAQSTRDKHKPHWGTPTLGGTPTGLGGMAIGSKTQN